MANSDARKDPSQQLVADIEVQMLLLPSAFVEKPGVCLGKINQRYPYHFPKTAESPCDLDGRQAKAIAGPLRLAWNNVFLIFYFVLSGKLGCLDSVFSRRSA